MPAGSQEFQEIEILRSRISKLEAHVQFLYKHLSDLAEAKAAVDEIRIRTGV